MPITILVQWQTYTNTVVPEPLMFTMLEEGHWFLQGFFGLKSLS